jgi:hypothetical protein
MRLDALTITLVLSLASSMVHAQQAPDPLFGSDPYAKAVLDCHSDYATRYATAMTGTRATPTEIATAAYAHSIKEMSRFSAETARSAAKKDSTGLLDVERYVADQNSVMRDYAFAYTLDVYLKKTTNF